MLKNDKIVCIGGAHLTRCDRPATWPANVQLPSAPSKHMLPSQRHSATALEGQAMSPLPVVKEPASWAVLVRSREEVRKVLEAAQQHNKEELAPVRTQETRGHACRRVGGCGVVLTGACAMLLTCSQFDWPAISA